MAGKVQQHSARSTTVRDIVKRARGPQPELRERQDLAAAFFGNFPRSIDLQECLNIRRRAEEEFMQFHPDVRIRFANDPARLVEFVQNEENYEEAVKMGLISIEAQESRKAAEIAAQKAAAKPPEGTK